MAITPEDIGGDENVARRILVRARGIAPCIDTFADDSEAKKDAIAILKGVLTELPAPGESRMRSMSRNGTSVSLEMIRSAFDGDPAASLRSLCGASSFRGHSVGSFPVDSPVGRVWPEGEYS